MVKVADGDTATILDASNRQHKIRFHGIDAPEKSQAFGKAAAKHLASLIAGREVVVKVQDVDQYGRTVGKVFADGRDINLEMIRAGYAWHYRRFDKSPSYAAAESEARSAKRGLWSDPHPINPAEFRRGGKAHSASAQKPVATTGGSRSVATAPRIEYRAGNAMPVGSRTPAPVCDKWPDTGYWLSTNSNKRHNRKCENYRKTRGYPCSKSEGTPCGKCGG